MKINRLLVRKIQAKYPHEDVDTEGSWAISYGDMITLLLTFFIIFFSINPSNSTPKETVQEETADGLTISLIKALQAERQADVYTETYSKPGESQEQINLSDETLAETGISEKVLEAIKGKAHLKGQEILVEFPEISFFDSAKVELRPAAEIALRDFAKVFMPYMGHFQVSIRAFTDSRKVRADTTVRYKDNLELSALRGVAAMRVLQQSGLPLERLKVGGYGELRDSVRKLASTNDFASEEEKLKSLSLSRKVVLVIEPYAKKKEASGGTHVD